MAGHAVARLLPENPVGRRRILFIFLFFSMITCCLCQSSSTTAPAPPAVSNPNAKCIVTEPLYNGTFDLTGLRSTFGHRFQGFTFNMCGGGSNEMTCHNASGVSACMQLDDKTKSEFILGYGSPVPSLKGSKVSFEYVGEKCENNSNYSLTVRVECDYKMERDPITLIHKEKCNYLLRLKSSHACMQASGKSLCSSSIQLTKNKELNLGQLSKNNLIAVDGPPQTKFIVNICNPVIYGPTAECPPDTHVCVYDEQTKKYSSIGSSDGQIIDQVGWTALNFTSGTPCKENPSQNYSSIISLRCDSTQSFIYHDTILCKHFFDLFTPLACGLVDPPCVTSDPNTKVEYDLSSLSAESYNVSGKMGLSYQFGICKAPSFCPDGCGACSSLHSSMGVVNSELRMGEAGYPYLIYPNGPACKDLKNQSTNYVTKIQFTCAATPEEKNKATLVEEADCSLIIDFATDKVCDKAISCADDGFDLSPLIRSKSNFVADVAGDVLKNATNKDVKFYLNVCRPLVSQYGLSCHGGSAVCRANVGSGKPENETSLGYPDVSLTVVNTSEGERPQLKYLRGDPCPSHPLENSTSTIEFRCSEKVGRGRPVLQRIEDECHYHFDWETNVICPARSIPFDSKACSLTNLNVTGGTFNMSEIGSGGSVKLNDATINLCSLTNYTATIDYFGQKVFVRLQEATVKGKGTLVLECHSSKNDTKQEEGEFEWVITFISPAVCKLFGDQLEEDVPPPAPVSTTTTTTVAPPPKVPSDKDSSTTTTTVKPTSAGNASATDLALPPVPPARSGMSAWGITGILFLLCSIFVIVGFTLRSPQRRAQVMSLFRRKNVAVSYTRVSREEASLLMAPAGLSESDDELLV